MKSCYIFFIVEQLSAKRKLHLEKLKEIDIRIKRITKELTTAKEERRQEEKASKDLGDLLNKLLFK